MDDAQKQMFEIEIKVQQRYTSIWVWDGSKGRGKAVRETRHVGVNRNDLKNDQICKFRMA